MRQCTARGKGGQNRSGTKPPASGEVILQDPETLSIRAQQIISIGKLVQLRLDKHFVEQSVYVRLDSEQSSNAGWQSRRARVLETMLECWTATWAV